MNKILKLGREKVRKTLAGIATVGLVVLLISLFLEYQFVAIVGVATMIPWFVMSTIDDIVNSNNLLKGILPWICMGVAGLAILTHELFFVPLGILIILSFYVNFK